MQCFSFTMPRTAHYYSLGAPGLGIEHLWVCLHGHDQPVAGLAAQLVNLDTPERLLILPEALSRHARPETPDRVADALGVWFAPHSVDDDLADVTTYLDGLTDAIRARCPAGTPVTVLGYGPGAAAAMGWLAENHLVFERLILYAAVLPPEIDRRAGAVFGLARAAGRGSRHHHRRLLARSRRSRLGAGPARCRPNRPPQLRR